MARRDTDAPIGSYSDIVDAGTRTFAIPSIVVLYIYFGHVV